MLGYQTHLLHPSLRRITQHSGLYHRLNNSKLNLLQRNGDKQRCDKLDLHSHNRVHTLFITKITMAKKSNTGIPGFSFSWKRALGITQAKQKIARETGIPLSKTGVERKIGKAILDIILKKKLATILLG